MVGDKLANKLMNDALDISVKYAKKINMKEEKNN